MKVLISGSTGLIGSALVSFLTNAGHDVLRLVRSAPKSDGSEVHWDPESGRIDNAGLEGMDAVVHLAGRISVQADGLATEKHESLTAESKERGYFANRSRISHNPRRYWYPRQLSATTATVTKKSLMREAYQDSVS